MSLSNSPSDSGFKTLGTLVAQRAILRVDDPKLSEADTRAKLIDPVFRDVLHWSESEIRREEPADAGFADYVLGADASYILVEAKRSKPRFRLEAPSRPRKLQLEGPHLLGNKKVRPYLEQAQRYASDLGAHVAVVTNGTQFILFRPYQSGRSWSRGIALVYHSHDAILSDFAAFYRLLGRANVIAGELLDAFEEAEGITESLYTPISYVQDADEELVRNPFWARISQVMAPLLTDHPETPNAQEEIIRHCYVKTRLSDQADDTLNRLLQDEPSAALKDAGVKDTGTCLPLSVRG